MELNTKQEQSTDMKLKQWRMGKDPQGVTYYRAGNQEADGVQVSGIMRVPMVTGVRHNEQPGDLEAWEGAHVTRVAFYCPQDKVHLRNDHAV